MLPETGRILPLRILVKPIEEKKITSSGIIIPTEVIRPKTIAGEVVLVGEGTPSMQMVVKPSDRVLHGPNSFVVVDIEGESYRLLNQQEVLFIY